MFRERGRLAHVELTLTPRGEAEGGSRIQATITEMRVRNITVVSEDKAEISPKVLGRLERQVRAEIAAGSALDLDDLNSQIKQRLFLGDVTVRASVEPVDADYIDVKVVVGNVPPAPMSGLVQYDNTGARSSGRDRIIGVVSKSGLLIAGDRVDALAMKAMDVGGGDTDGAIYGRVAYEVPQVNLGARLSVWASYMPYNALGDVTASTNASGNTTEIGGGAHRPLFIGRDLSVLGHAEFLQKWQQDYLLSDVQTNNKFSQNGRLRADVSYRITPAQVICFNGGVMVGNLDLSGNEQSLEQDETGPRVNGVFAKYEVSAVWQGRFGADNKIDTRFDVRGQLASKNLDSMEKMTLGGPNGLRAFSATEAPGSQGYIVKLETGYQLFPWLRAAGFYEFGGIERYVAPYSTTDSIPNSYVLQDAGVSFTSSFESIDASLSFAQQIGSNSGLSTDGLNSDNSQQRYRLFATLAHHF